MQFTFASLQVFVIAGIMLQFAAGSPIGLNKPVDTSVGEDGDKLLWLSEPTKPSKRMTMGQVDTHVGEDGDKLLRLSEPTKPSKRVTMGEVFRSQDGEPGLDWLNNLVPVKRTIVEDGEPGLDWLNNLAPAKRAIIEDGEPGLDWLNNLVPAKRTIIEGRIIGLRMSQVPKWVSEDGEPGLDWLNNLAPAKRDKVQDRDAADPWGDFVVKPASS
ncbi:hypothetical protein C8J57DRAFT_1472725 [Mycena rebaudengoi]|nr:hypothetical protein C8J57DRAFT_1472725 [Mycena rebaudengoi]